MAKFSKKSNLPLISGFALLLAAAPAAGPCQTRPDYAEARSNMVARQLKARDITDPRVLAAMGQVPRHLLCRRTWPPWPTATIPCPSAAGKPSPSLTSSP